MVWIRSQDKMRLIDAKNIHVSYFSFSNCYQFEVCIDSENIEIIAEYSSEEKALEVMDMINEYIRNGTGMYFHLYDGCGDGYECTKPFEMPQDDEVEV